MGNTAVIISIGIIGLLIVLFFVFVPIGLWISSLAANVKISIFNLTGMRLRRVVPSTYPQWQRTVLNFWLKQE